MFSKNKENGEMAELELMYEASKRGLIPSTPFGDNRKYDMVLDNNKKMFKVQVKTTTIKNKTGYHITTSYGSRVKKLYGNLVDVFAIKIEDTGDWYFIPSDKINCKSLNLYPSKKEHKFNKYKNNWKLLLTI